jgi:dienelactone hydrolase
MVADTLPEPHSTLLETVPLSPQSRIVGEDIVYEHDGIELEGYLAFDESHDGRRPGVLIIHDWTGVGPTVRMRAQMLARLGYVAFAADIYGRGVRPTGDAASAEAHKYYGDLPLLRARVAAGFDRLAADPRVDPDRIAVIGYCFGGSAALEFARTGASVRGVASFHGGLIVHDPSDAADIRASVLVMTGAEDPVVPDDAVVAFQNELGAPHAFTIPGAPSYREQADQRSWRELVGFLTETIG